MTSELRVTPAPPTGATGWRRVGVPGLRRVILAGLALASSACASATSASRAGAAVSAVPTMAVRRAEAGPAVFWNSATIYFLLLDRFANGDPSNDTALGRAQDGAVMRSMAGGDLRGLRERIESGWFDSLGVDAIWLTPFVEQVRGAVDEGTGRTYGYHGYWARDWTAVDPAWGTKDDVRAVVDAAHRRGIRVLMDAVINHTGPVTAEDGAWPADWVRTSPTCAYRDYRTTTACTLVANLPDVLTESEASVELPAFLREKWQREGRLEAERASLDAFFRRTGHPRAPRWYLVKWLTDWVREFGFDGYRVDTAKHFGESVSLELRREAEAALEEWRARHPDALPSSLPFFMLGEVYGWGATGGRHYGFGDRNVDYFAHGYDALINFGFKAEAAGSLASLYARDAESLTSGALRGVAQVNYVSSHDDGQPLDPERREPLRTGTALLLAPGAAQIYYGDELARPLRIAGAEGDANLRGMMNWADLAGGSRAAEVLAHWRTLARFRLAHPAVGAGRHVPISSSPLVFARMLERGALTDRVVVAMLQDGARPRIPVGGVFPNGTTVRDAVSGRIAHVRDDTVSWEAGADLVLLEAVP